MTSPLYLLMSHIIPEIAYKVRLFLDQNLVTDLNEAEQFNHVFIMQIDAAFRTRHTHVFTIGYTMNVNIA